MVGSLSSSPCSENAQPDNIVVYGAKFGVVFLAKGPCRPPVQEGLDHFGFHNPHLKRGRPVVFFVVEFPLVISYTHPRYHLFRTISDIASRFLVTPPLTYGRETPGTLEKQTTGDNKVLKCTSTLKDAMV